MSALGITNVPDTTLFERGPAALILGVTPARVGTLTREGKLVFDAAGKITLAQLKEYEKSKAKPVGFKKAAGGAKLYLIELLPDQFTALKDKGFNVREVPRYKPSPEAKERRAANDRAKLEAMGIKL